MTVILNGARTPIGKYMGALSGYSAVQLGGFAIAGALQNAGISASDVDYVFMGQTLQAGSGQIPARQAALLGGVGMNVPATSVNKVCLSGIHSIALADQMIRLGLADVVVAGGMESMSQAPLLLTKVQGGIEADLSSAQDSMMVDGLMCAIDHKSMGQSTDELNARYDLTRAEQDEFAVESHMRAARAQDRSILAQEIISVSHLNGSDLVTQDECIRAASTQEKLAQLQPAFTPGGTITAGNASTIADGAAAIVLVSERKAAELGQSGLVTIVGHGMVAGPDASLHEQPAHAIRQAALHAGVRVEDLDVLEINEAFAAVAIVSQRALGVDLAKVNPNGGAIALGHPLGMSGARLVLHLAHEMHRQQVPLGAAALCGGSGQGEALILRSKLPS